MSDRGPMRPVSTTQIVAVLSCTLALFFMVAFVTKSVDAYRLRNWRDRLQAEIDDMLRQRQELEQELERRQGRAWAEEVLRDAGQVPPGGVRILPVPVTPQAVVGAPVQPTPPAAGSGAGAGRALFDNPQWRAWRLLIWGFD